MTLAQLRYTIAIAKAGSMNEAAKSLYISQPSLSTAIRELGITNVRLHINSIGCPQCRPVYRENLQEYLPEGVKLSLYCLDDVKKVYERMSGNWKEKFAINISGEKWVDINDPEATKGNAVRWLQRELGISREETVVFGDNFNDMSMLACGDRSYASVLSAPEVKQAARYEVASYEEDGVLQVLKDILQEVAHEK